MELLAEKQRNAVTCGALPCHLRRQNSLAVLQQFCTGEPLTAADVSARTGVSRQTVTKAIADFIHHGLIISVGKGASTETGGKRPLLYRLCAERYILCIAFGENATTLALYGLDGKQLAPIDCAVQADETLEQSISAMDIAAARLWSRLPRAQEGLCGVSAFVDGIVEAETGIVRVARTHSAWGKDAPLGAMLRNRFPGVQILVQSAARAAGEAIMQSDCSQGKRTATLHTANGIAACYIAGGQVQQGAHALAGEIGHMMLDMHDGEVCPCGGRGCFEQLVSVHRLRAVAAAQTKKLAQSVLQSNAQAFTLADLFAAAQGGDLLARELLDYAAWVFACALRNVMLHFDAELVLIQGNFAHAGSWFEACLAKWLPSMLYGGVQPTIECDTVPLPRRQLDGAAAALRRSFFNALFEKEEDGLPTLG